MKCFQDSKHTHVQCLLSQKVAAKPSLRPSTIVCYSYDKPPYQYGTVRKLKGPPKAVTAALIWQVRFRLAAENHAHLKCVDRRRAYRKLLQQCVCSCEC